MNTKKLKVGEVLSRIMAERGLSTKQVSTMCGVPVSTLTHIKNGRAVRELSHVVKLAHCLDVSFHYMCFGEPDKFELENALAREVFDGVFEISIKRYNKKAKEAL